MCIPHLWHKLAFSFIPHTPTFKIKFLIPYHRFTCLNIKIWYHTSQLWTFWFTHQSCVCSSFVAKLCIFFMSHTSSLKFKFFQFHVIDYFFSSDSHLWTQRTDITGACYEILIYSRALVCALLICGTSLVFRECVTPRLSKLCFKLSSFRFHIIVCSVRFDSHVWT